MISDNQVQGRLGHPNINTTLDSHSRRIPLVRRLASDKLAAPFT